MLINAVFQGGGVKGIALAGAASAAEEHGYEFNQVAGSSSGAIVASLIAAGYRSDELKTVIEETPYRNFLRRSPIFNTKVIGPLARLFIKKGLYSGEALEYWIYKLLLAKGIRTFGDLEKDQLRIIASDISERKLLVLPDDIGQYGIDPERLTVAKAVRMSTSIPYFFDPVVVRRKTSGFPPLGKFADSFSYIVDGGLLSNFPLWLFDEPPKSFAEPMIPTIGFQLVGRGTGQPNVISGPVSMMKALFSTMLEAHDDYYIKEEYRFRTIKIPADGVGMTDFELSEEQSQKLFESGKAAAERFFGKWKYEEYKKLYLMHVYRKQKEKAAGP